MPALNIKIPPELPESMKHLINQMQQLNANTTKFQQSQSNVIQFPRQHIVSDFRRINQIFNKFETTIQRTIDSALLGFGSTARAFIRRLTFAPDFLSGVSNLLKYVRAPVGTVTLAVGRFFGVGFVYEFAKWIFSKAIDFAKAMQTDQRLALSAGTTLGGIRALRVGFDILPGMDELTQTIGTLAGQLTERQFAVIHTILGVQQYADTTRTVVEAILAAQRFMKTRQASNALQIARELGLTDTFNPQALLMLRNMSTREAEYRARATLGMQKGLGLPPEIRENLQRLIITDQWMWEGISNTFGETLYRTGLATTLIQLSNSFGVFIDKFAKSQFADDAARKLMKGMERLNSSIKPMLPDLERLTVEVKSVVADFIAATRTVTRILNETQSALHKLGKGLSFISPAYSGELPARYREGLRPEAGVGAPSGSPYAPGSLGGPSVSGPQFRPGVTRPGLRREPRQEPRATRGPEIPPRDFRRPPRSIGTTTTPVPQPGGAKPTAVPVPSPTGRVPRVGEPIRGVVPPSGVRGLPGGPSGPAMERGPALSAGAIDRSRFEAELRDNPELRERVLQIAANEQSTNPEGTQAIIESMMNRAEVRHHTLAQEARWTSEGGYYEDTRGRERAIRTAADPNSRPILERSLNNALGGSNISNYAYGNASGDTARSKLNPNNPQGAQYRSDFGGETFFGPNRDEPRYTRNYDKWLQEQQARPQEGGDRVPRPNVGQVDPYAPGVIRPGLPGTPSGPAAPPKGTVLFLHGMQSRYGDKSPAQVEADARRFAEAKGLKFEAIDVSGDNRTAQERAARARLDQGGVSHIFGFSAGGYTADHLRKDYPNLDYTITGSPGAKGNIDIPNTGHMDLVGAVADRATKDASGTRATGAASSSYVTEPEGPLSDQKDRPFYYGGTIAMDDKEYHYGTGGGGRGSVPYGTYMITPKEMGSWGYAHGAIGVSHNKIWDPQLNSYREGIEIHSASSDAIDRLHSAGCFAVSRSEYPAFKAALMEKIRKEGTQYMTVGPDGHIMIGPRPPPGKVPDQNEAAGHPTSDKPNFTPADPVQAQKEADKVLNKNKEQPDTGSDKSKDKKEDKPRQDTKADQEDKSASKQSNGKAKAEDKIEINDHAHTSPDDKHADMGGSMKGGLKVDNRTDQKVTVEYA